MKVTSRIPFRRATSTATQIARPARPARRWTSPPALRRSCLADEAQAAGVRSPGNGATPRLRPSTRATQQIPRRFAHAPSTRKPFPTAAHQTSRTSSSARSPSHTGCPWPTPRRKTTGAIERGVLLPRSAAPPKPGVAGDGRGLFRLAAGPAPVVAPAKAVPDRVTEQRVPRRRVGRRRAPRHDLRMRAPI